MQPGIIESDYLPGSTAERLFQEGQEKGRVEGRLEVARRMLEKGMSIDDVIHATLLSLEQLREAGLAG